MEIAIPYVAPGPFGETFAARLGITLEGAEQAGFDGVEVHLIGMGRRRILSTICQAGELGLTTTIHQGWSLTEGWQQWYNWALAATGCIPITRFKLAEHIPAGTAFPVVVSGERFEEAENHPNWWLQTTCSLHGVQERLEHLFWDRFMPAAKSGRFGLVFDTQHFLEGAYGVRGVGYLNRQDPLELLVQLRYGWKLLGPFVKEIHLCDFDPERGHTFGRNVFPGTGILARALQDFCHIVKESGWDGRVVPEVLNWPTSSPRQYGELRKRVVELFE